MSSLHRASVPSRRLSISILSRTSSWAAPCGCKWQQQLCVRCDTTATQQGRSTSCQSKTKIPRWWSWFHQTEKTESGKREVSRRKILGCWQKTDQSSTCLEAIHKCPLQPFHELPDCPTSHDFPPSPSSYSWCSEKLLQWINLIFCSFPLLPKVQSTSGEKSLLPIYHLVPGDLPVLVIISHPSHFKRMPPPTILFIGLLYSAFKRDSPTHPVTRTSSRMFCLVPHPPPSCFVLSPLACHMPCGHFLSTRLGPAGARC